MEETSIDLAMQPAAKVEGPLEVPHTKASLKDLLEEAEMDETMKEVEGPPPSQSLL
jgi:hypothetical protein